MSLRVLSTVTKSLPFPIRAAEEKEPPKEDVRLRHRVHDRPALHQRRLRRELRRAQHRVRLGVREPHERREELRRLRHRLRRGPDLHDKHGALRGA
jgi:hypothetical protein